MNKKMTKCENCNVNTSNLESFELDKRLQEHENIIGNRDLGKDYEWSEKSRKYELVNKKIITLSYCGDCAKVIKKIEIKRVNGFQLETEVEKISSEILNLKNILVSIIEKNDNKITNLLEDNNKLLSENNQLKQEIIDIKSKEESYFLIEN
jgi:hypothetical protein